MNPLFLRRNSIRFFVVHLLLLCVSVPFVSKGELVANRKAPFDAKNIFRTAVFHENSGIVDNITDEKILYYVRHGNIDAFFTPDGIIYKVVKVDEKELQERKDERKNSEGKETEEEEKGLPLRASAVHMQWVGANPNPEIESGAKEETYYTYLKADASGKKTLTSLAYKTITYKNMYPGVDVVYSLPESGLPKGWNTGMKYNLIVHPGADVSKIKIAYTGKAVNSVQKNANGDIVIETNCGNIIEHAPASFSEKNQIVKTEFEVSNNNIQFIFPEGYPANQTLTIDPWVTVLSTLPPYDQGFDVDYDFQGNLFVYGAGPTTIYDYTDYFEVAKYDPTGNALWIFNGAVPAIGWNSYDALLGENLPGNMIVDKTSGKLYVGKGIDQYGTSTIRLTTDGQYDNFVSNINASFRETWCFAYDCSTGNLLAMGGGTASDLNMGIINTTTQAISTSNITGITTPNPNDGTYGQDILSGTYDGSGHLYVIMNSRRFPYELPYYNTLYKVNSTYNGYDWVANSNFTSFTETENDQFWDNVDVNNGNGYNALAANNNYLYYYDGENVAAYDLATGNMVGNPYYFDAYNTLYQGGIAVDNCNHVYVGGVGVVNTFTFDGANFNPGADIVLGDGLDGSGVHDVKFNSANNLLYVAGDYFVGTYKASLSGGCIAPASFSIVATHTCDSATIHVSPASGLSPAVFTYVWTDISGNIVSETSNSADTINTIGLGDGTYIVQVQWNGNCGGYGLSDTVTLACSFTHSNDTTICAGHQVILSAHATGSTGTYSWSPGGATTSSITVSPATTTSYTVTYTPSNGSHPDVAVITVTVLGIPTVAVSDTSICSGSQGTLFAIPSYSGGTYNWSPGGATTSSITASPTTSTTYTVTYTTVCGTATGTGTINVTPAPTLTTTNDTVCADGSAQISATPSIGGGTYSWSPGGYTTSTISVSPGITTTYTVTYSSAGCLNATATAVVVISPPPTLTTTGASICVGNQAQISATPSIGGGTYSWSPGGQTTSSITVIPGITTTYTVTYVLSGCGSVTATATVNVTPVPTVTANGTILCHGDTGQISATPNPAGGTYSWSPGGATTGTVTVSPATTATYTVTYTLNGCSATDVATVTVNALPLIQLTTTNASCGQQNGKIIASASGATAPYSYFWNNLVDISTPVDSSLAAGTYTVSVYDSKECSALASVAISQSSQVSATDTIHPFPCAKPPYGSVIITATGGLAPYTYSIEGVDTNSTGQFNPVAPGEYSYTVTDTTGCTVSGSFVVPSGFAIDSFDITADSTSCFGLSDGSVTITPILTPNQPYTYSINGGTPETGTVFDSLPAGDYQVIVHNNIGCTDTLNTIVYQPDPVIVNIIPDTIPLSNHDTSSVILSTTNGFINPIYFWYPSSGLSCTSCIAPTATVDEPSVIAPPVYYLQVSDSLNSNCKAYDSVVIMIIGQFKMPDAFTPNGDGKNDLFGPATHSYLTIKEFHIYNRWGQLIHNSTDLWDGKYKGEEQPAGTYVYYIVVEYPELLSPGNTITKKQEGSVVLLR